MSPLETQLFDELKQRATPIPLEQAQRIQWQDRFNALPAVQASEGFLDASDSHVCQIRLATLKPHHLGGLGDGKAIVNGAVISGMFDAALGVAGTIQFPGKRAGTIELSIKLLRPAMGPLTALSICNRSTSTLAFVEAYIVSNNRLCATATGLCATTSRQPA